MEINNPVGVQHEANFDNTGLRHQTEKNIAKIMDIEASQKKLRTPSDIVADAVAAFFGSMTFVWVHVVWFGGWIIVNSTLAGYEFDPFPYTFLTLVVSLEAIFLSTFILISQNHETRLTERRNHLDLQINLLAEAENTKMLSLLSRIAEKLDVQIDNPELIRALEEDTHPEQMIGQIKEASERVAKNHNAPNDSESVS